MDDNAKATVGASSEQKALAVLRFALGALFIWVFFENLGKGAYTPGGYKGVIDYYLKNGHAPEVWKGVMWRSRTTKHGRSFSSERNRKASTPSVASLTSNPAPRSASAHARREVDPDRGRVRLR